MKIWDEQNQDPFIIREKNPAKYKSQHIFCVQKKSFPIIFFVNNLQRKVKKTHCSRYVVVWKAKVILHFPITFPNERVRFLAPQRPRAFYG